MDRIENSDRNRNQLGSAGIEMELEKIGSDRNWIGIESESDQNWKEIGMDVCVAVLGAVLS